MAREDPYFRLRIPEALKARVERAAAENRRSMTAEILDRLAASFEAEHEVDRLRLDAGHFEKRLSELKDAQDLIKAELEKHRQLLHEAREEHMGQKDKDQI